MINGQVGSAPLPFVSPANSKISLFSQSYDGGVETPSVNTDMLVLFEHAPVGVLLQLTVFGCHPNEI